MKTNIEVLRGLQQEHLRWAELHTAMRCETAAQADRAKVEAIDAALAALSAQAEAQAGGEVICSICEEVIDKIGQGYVPRGHGVYSRPFEQPDALAFGDVRVFVDGEMHILSADNPSVTIKPGQRFVVRRVVNDTPVCGAATPEPKE